MRSLDARLGHRGSTASRPRPGRPAARRRPGSCGATPGRTRSQVETGLPAGPPAAQQHGPAHRRPSGRKPTGTRRCPAARLARFSASSAAVWKPGRTITSGPPQGKAHPVGERAAGFAAVERQRCPAVRVWSGARDIVQHDQPVQQRSRRATRRPASGARSATAPGITAASCSKAAGPRRPRRRGIELPDHHGRASPPVCPGPPAAWPATGSAHSGRGIGRSTAAIAPRPAPAGASKGKYHSAPSGTITSSSKASRKIGRRALQAASPASCFAAGFHCVSLRSLRVNSWFC